MTETTIVAWDGSAPARSALEWAARWASGGDLTLVRVLEDSIGITDYIVDDSMVDAARAALEDAAAEVRLAHPDLRVESEFVRGDPIGELRRRSAPNRLVVVGTHRREGSKLRFEWSVGARLAASARGPVAIVPETDSATRSGVVVGIDGSTASDAAVAFAAEHASRSHQPLRIIHAWQEPPVWQGPDSLDPVPSQDFLDSLEDTHQQILNESVTKVTDAWPELPVRGTLMHGPPQPALLEASRGAAVLVVGNHGLHGVERLLLGSVSHALVLNIVSPTIVISAPPET
ncbi:universal stress protein [Cryobacterium sp. Sr8]|uniref:Nucleotide-binding universal stress protein, UspA family n=1 Tax=Cryobacterium psychrotolerans TaxID=386301 RepID=A0A1G9G936_9MICO|nr:MULTISPECIES: universal stress protein [Cryobacterium]TFD42359.1 universal stress protein [Cryobacterium sp. TMT1-2-1]TFD81537.1 universal stress protein [Cryobacterium sp. Sr8]TFD83827.1 universal stress protein [Cryobacterium psychrotolerans]SDK97142.1 Nucleotide-binding universal stress protein, UspA family [Cryobacterium psychrotolerans]